MITNMIGFAAGAIIGTMAVRIVYEAKRRHDNRKLERRRTMSTDAVVTAVYKKNRRRWVATYEYSPDMDAAGSDETEECDVPVLSSAVSFDPDLYDITVDCLLEVMYDPEDPESVYVPEIDRPPTATTGAYLATQALRLLVLAEAVALAALV